MNSINTKRVTADEWAAMTDDEKIKAVEAHRVAPTMLCDVIGYDKFWRLIANQEFGEGNTKTVLFDSLLQATCLDEFISFLHAVDILSSYNYFDDDDSINELTSKVTKRKANRRSSKQLKLFDELKSNFPFFPHGGYVFNTYPNYDTDKTSTQGAFTNFLDLLDKIDALRNEQIREIREANLKSHTITHKLRSTNHLATPSHESYHETRKVVARKALEQSEDSPFPTGKLNGSTVTGTLHLIPPDAAYDTKITARNVEDRIVRSMWEHRAQLSDSTVDYLDALFAIWIEQTKSPDDVTVACIDDLLHLRGLQEKPHGDGRRSGFTKRQRDEVLAEIARIECIYLTVVEYKRRGRKKPTVIQSRALAILDRQGDQEVDGEIDIERIVFRPGKIFGQYLQTEGRQTALLARKALNYHSHQQVPEKRLARYLSWQWRIRSNNENNEHPYQISTLLEEAGIEVTSRNPHRAINRLEKALEQLGEDKILARWNYREGWDEEWTLPQKLNWSIEILRNFASPCAFSNLCNREITLVAS